MKYEMRSVSVTSRRAFLQTCAAGVASLTLADRLRLAFANPVKGKKAKACILIFLEGGPSHIDTFDPKPGSATNGPFEAIDTTIPGVRFSQCLPQLAKVADRLAILRSVNSREGDHDRAVHLLHTGYIPNPGVSYPSVGSTIARHRAADEDSAPPYVSLFGEQGAGFLGPEFGPFRIDNLDQPSANLDLPEGTSEARLNYRLQALAQFNLSFSKMIGSRRPQNFTQLALRSNRLRQSPALRPQDLEQEPEALREAYGLKLDDPTLARACMLARRMLEHGGRFVEIHYGGWDTHADNFNQVQLLATRLDAALSSLITDLGDRGLLESTLVACLGEFGRTPVINGASGRDHWSDAFSVVLAGGGVRGGQVIGLTDDQGGQVKERPISVPDLHASILHAFELEPTQPHSTPDGRLVRFTDNGKVVSELFGG